MGSPTMARYEMRHSTSNLQDVLHGGRPRDEGPHVKKASDRNSESGIDYVVRVDLDELGIAEDEFDDLQSLFLIFDSDRDGILNLRELHKMVKCLGLHVGLEEAKTLANLVSVDTA